MILRPASSRRLKTVDATVMELDVEGYYDASNHRYLKNTTMAVTNTQAMSQPCITPPSKQKAAAST